jgi:hypothetical protein
MSRPRTYPNEIFLSIEQEVTGDEYLQANKTPEGCAVLGEKKRVGRYMLHEVIYVEGKVVTTGATLQCHPSLRKK